MGGARAPIAVLMAVVVAEMAFGSGETELPLVYRRVSPARSAGQDATEPAPAAKPRSTPALDAQGTAEARPSDERAAAGNAGAAADAVPGQAADAGAVLAETSGPCPDDMVFVQGQYCTKVSHECERWLDDEKLPFARCAEYHERASCVGERVSLSFCIDRYEYTAEDEALPLNFQSFVRASKLCKQLGKRICTEDEWNFACEGEKMLPYPYGFDRKPVCNQDQTDLYDRTRRGLKDLRKASRELPDCVSPFGVYNMVGNLDEPVLRPNAKHAYPFRNALKGGWWMAGRNRCRPATTAHDDHYRDIQIGVRCCKDLAPSDDKP